jgi:hypothetical protein
MASDKEILYNVIAREVHNLVQGVPMLGLFEGAISNYIIKFIDPYVSAFMEGDSLDVEQLSSFTSHEIDSKIAEFKKSYKKELIKNED